MTMLNHNVLIKTLLTRFTEAQMILTELAAHIAKPKAQTVQDLLGQIGELLLRVEAAASSRELTGEVARAIARDCETLSARWQELAHYTAETLRPDDYVYPSQEERVQGATQTSQAIRTQTLQALSAAGEMWRTAREWRKAASCFSTVAQFRQAEPSPLAPLAAMVREYLCYEELGDAASTLRIGHAIRKVLGSSANVPSSEDRSTLAEAAAHFRKTAMTAISDQKENREQNLGLGGVYLWCEAEALSLAADPMDSQPAARFKALAEYYLQAAREAPPKAPLSTFQAVANYVEAALAYLRVKTDLQGLSVQDAHQYSSDLQRAAVDEVAKLLERLGYQQVRVSETPAKAMKAWRAVLSLVAESYRVRSLFSQLAQDVADLLVRALQRGDGDTREAATLFRWVCEGADRGVRVICLKLIADVYRLGILGKLLDFASQMELRQVAQELLGVQDDQGVFEALLDAELEFNDVVNLFASLDIFWLAAMCQQCQGQLRTSISTLERSLAGAASFRAPSHQPSTKEGEPEPASWGAAPSEDFIAAAELFSRGFRQQRVGEIPLELGLRRSWMPLREPELLRRRAADSHRLAGLALLREGRVERGREHLIRAKDAYEMLGRHWDAVETLEDWAGQLVTSIQTEEKTGEGATQDRLGELLEVCDELVGLYALRHSGVAAVRAILGTVKYLRNHVSVANWTLPVFLRAIEYTREAVNTAQLAGIPEEAVRPLQQLRQELQRFLGGDFVIGVYPDFELEANVYFEAETPVKLAVLNVSDHARFNLAIRPLGVLAHLSPSVTQPWTASRDPAQITAKHFYVGTDDNAFDLGDMASQRKPADAFGPPRSLPPPTATAYGSSEKGPAPPASAETEMTAVMERPWLGVMWTGNHRGTSIGSLPGATEVPTEPEQKQASLDEITVAAFFTVFTKAAREGNILPGQVFPVTFGIFEPGSDTPIATQTLFFKIASRPKILDVETGWATDVAQTWEETFSIRYEEGAHLPRYVPRFSPEFEPKDYVNPSTLVPTITLGSDAVNLAKYLKRVPPRFTLRYAGQTHWGDGQQLSVKSTISLRIPMAGPIGGEYEFLQIETPQRWMTTDEVAVARLRNGVNFQEVFYGTVFIGDARYDGEYFVYRLWCCFEPGEQEPAAGARYRQGWTNHRLDIFIDPRTWQPRLLVTDYYVKLENGHGEWIEALYSFKAASSTFFGIRPLLGTLHREAAPSYFHRQFEGEVRRLLAPLGIDGKTTLKMAGFRLGQRLGFVNLIRASWARDKRDGPVTHKPLRAHLFRDYWSQRYEHGLYRTDWHGSTSENRYEMRTLDRTGGKSKYVSGLEQRIVNQEVTIVPRSGDHCDLFVESPGGAGKRIVIRNVINPRAIELWTRPHISFSRRFNWFAKRFGRPPRIHTASLYLYSTRRALNPYYKGSKEGKDQWIHYPESAYWNGKRWASIPTMFEVKAHPENLAAGINSWLDADTYWVYRYVWFWPLEWTWPLPHEDWERADIWVNARTGNLEWITSDYHWRELWYENSAKTRGVNPTIDFLFNWNTPEPLTVKDGAQVHQSIVPEFGENRQIGEFADQLPWMFARYRHSAEHMHKLHASFWNRHKVAITYSVLFVVIVSLIYFLTPLGSLIQGLLPP